MYSLFTITSSSPSQFPSANPAAVAANVAASFAFIEYVRCASNMRSPCWQILSSGWQMTFVFEEAAPVTACPKSGSPKITTELTFAIVLAGSSFAALWTSCPPWEYPLMTTLVLGHVFSVFVIMVALRCISYVRKWRYSKDLHRLTTHRISTLQESLNTGWILHALNLH